MTDIKVNSQKSSELAGWPLEFSVGTDMNFWRPLGVNKEELINSDVCGIAKFTLA